MTDADDGLPSHVTITVRRLNWPDLAPHLPPRMLALLAPPVEVGVERPGTPAPVRVAGALPVADAYPVVDVHPVTEVCPVPDLHPHQPGRRREDTRVHRLRRLVSGLSRRS